MAIIHFGLYLIPEAGDFYDHGSAVVGYDIRAEQAIPSPSFIHPDWNGGNRQYGWHVTITDAITIEARKLPGIIETVRSLLTCLRETNEYTLRKINIVFWPEKSQQVAMRLEPNRNVEILHDLLVATVHPMGQGSVYYDQYLTNASNYFQGDSRPSRVAKTKHFYAPYILDEFAPHLTCVNPFNGTQEERSRLLQGLRRTFEKTTELHFTTLAMVVKTREESFYRIIEEFSLCGSVQ